MQRKSRLAAIAVLVLFWPAAAVLGQDNGDWRATLERVSPSIVSIRVDQTRAFDTEWNSSSQATGFVVDAERGLILTNRHVVTPGPVVAEAVFLNHEEVELTPVYRDPVHDFGFYRYDPGELRYIEPITLPATRPVPVYEVEIRVDDGKQVDYERVLRLMLGLADGDGPLEGEQLVKLLLGIQVDAAIDRDRIDRLLHELGDDEG